MLPVETREKTQTTQTLPPDVVVLTKEKIALSFEENYYSPELEAQDPYFDRATQAELTRRMATPYEDCIAFDPNDPESRMRVLEKAVTSDE